MKRLNLFLLLLMAAMVLPATLQAKKIKYGKCFVYSGGVKNDVPFGQGELKSGAVRSFMGKETLYPSISISGVFSDDGTVDNAEVTILEENKRHLKFHGKLSYRIQVDKNSKYVDGLIYIDLLEGDFDMEVKGFKESTNELLVPHKYICQIILGQKNGESEYDYRLGVSEPYEFEKGLKGIIIRKIGYDRLGECLKLDDRYTLPIEQKLDNGMTAKYEDPDHFNARFNGDWSKKSTTSDQLIILNSNGDSIVYEVSFPSIGYYSPQMEKSLLSFNRTFADGSSIRYVFGDGSSTRYVPVRRKEQGEIVYSDKSVYKGEVSIPQQSFDNLMLSSSLDAMGAKPFYGSLTTADGKSEEYLRGMKRADYDKWMAEEDAKREAELRRQKAQDEADLAAWKAKKAAKAKEEKKAYDALCKKYGKQYVDAAKNYQIIVGMPEELMIAQFAPQLELREQGSSYKVYYRRIPKLIKSKYESDYTTHIIWVRNGKVSNVRY